MEEKVSKCTECNSAIGHAVWCSKCELKKDSVYSPGVFLKSNDFELQDSGKHQEFATGAVRDSQEGKGRYDLIPPEAMRRWAIIFEKGAKKYGERNWEKGLPMSRYINSALRHLFQFIAGMDDEDHLGQGFWNIGGAITMQERFSGRDDIVDMPPMSTKAGAFYAGMAEIEEREADSKKLTLLIKGRDEHGNTKNYRIPLPKKLEDLKDTYIEIERNPKDGVSRSDGRTTGHT